MSVDTASLIADPEGVLGSLRLSDDLALPVDAVTEAFAILGRRGSGKTSTAVVLVEEMIQAGLPVIVVDPVGVWWGLRSSADGGEGLPVVIFGGDHGDLPLHEHAGGRLAGILLEHRPPAVLDVSGLSKTKARRFLADFCEELYRRNREPLHLVLDEADFMAPQKLLPDPAAARLLGAVDDIARRGRARGLGCTLISQRPAVLSKDVLSQISTLIVLQLTGVLDVKAIDEWMRLHDTEDQSSTVKASLASLPVGTAWLWSPAWLGLLQQMRVRPRLTFDSSATPKVGERRVTPGRLAPVDLMALRAELALVDDGITGEDPRAGSARIATLQQRIVDLEQQLADARDRPPLEVPVLPPGEADQLRTCVEAMRGTADSLLAVARGIEARLIDLATTPQPVTVRRPAPVSVPEAGSNGDRVVRSRVPLKAGARRMLDTLGRHHPMRVTRPQLATLTRMKVTGGTFGTYYSTLRRAGLIDELDGLTGLTDAGQRETSTDGEPATPEELMRHWRAALKAGARDMLDALVAAHPRSLTRSELAARANLELTGGTFGTYLSTLRRNGLIAVDGDRVTASPTLFLGR